MQILRTQHETAFYHTRSELNIDTSSHPEDRILEKESVRMILPSTSMERKEGAHGCQKHRDPYQTPKFSFQCLMKKRGVRSLLYLVKLQEVVRVILDDEHVVLLGQL